MTDLATRNTLMGRSSEVCDVVEGPRIRSASVLGRFPVRSMNSWLFGRCQIHRNSSCDCDFVRPSISSCGNCVDSSGAVLIESSDRGFGVRGISTCKSKWCCDFCARRGQVEDREKSEWLFRRHLDAGNQLALLTLTCGHSRGSSLEFMMMKLEAARKSLTDSVAWKSSPIVSTIRFHDVTFSPRNGWHAHLHVSLFLDGSGHDLDVLRALLAPVWNSRLVKNGVRGSSAALEVTDVASVHQAMYPHKEIPDEASEFDVDQDGTFEVEGIEGHSFEVGGMGDSVWDSMGGRKKGLTQWELAHYAAAGDSKAQSLWTEFYRATKGRSVASYSRDLSALWKGFKEEQPEPQEEPSGDPVALVASDLWAKAHFHRHRSLSQAGVDRCRDGGVDAMVDFWAYELDVDVGVSYVDAEGGPIPFLYVKELSHA